MLTFTYKDMAEMQQAIMLGTLQNSVLEYFQELEDLCDLPLGQYLKQEETNLFWHFLTLTMDEKEMLRLSNIYNCKAREYALQDNIDYCINKLAIIEQAKEEIANETESCFIRTQRR